MIDCGTWRERLALGLYEELEPTEVLELEHHLSTCGPCREYRTRLRAGLGRLSPPAWVPGLRSERGPADGPPRELTPRWTTWRTAAGFAAGILVGLMIGWGPPSSEDSAPAIDAAVGSAASFRRTGPPPLATTASSLNSLETWLER